MQYFVSKRVINIGHLLTRYAYIKVVVNAYIKVVVNLTKLIFLI